ncbi:MAG: hypothetical protein LVQ75_01690 [Candidatus Babeliales bacterium]|jgi:hypothetical protein
MAAPATQKNKVPVVPKKPVNTFEKKVTASAKPLIKKESGYRCQKD